MCLDCLSISVCMSTQSAVIIDIIISHINIKNTPAIIFFTTDLRATFALAIVKI